MLEILQGGLEKLDWRDYEIGQKLALAPTVGCW
jgi:hypothetical protein